MEHLFRWGQGNRIWISCPQIVGCEADFGNIIRVGDAENRHFGCSAWANEHRMESKTDGLGVFRTSVVKRIPNAIALVVP